MEDPDPLQARYCSVLQNMTKSLSDCRQAIKSLLSKRDTEEMNIQNGISLLSLKHQIMLSYLHSLTLLSAHRVLGHSLEATGNEIPSTSALTGFGDPERPETNGEPADLVDSLIEGRAVLEKTKGLESRLQYQIEKLVRLATEPVNNREAQDPLSFRPNLANFIQDEGEAETPTGTIAKSKSKIDKIEDDDEGDGIYRPPRIAPVPYDEDPRSKKKRASRLPAAVLSSVEYLTANGPHLESTTGLGNAGHKASGFSGNGMSVVGMSARARELAKMTEYEESNMTRLVLSKKEAKRRKQDEEMIALGGSGLAPLSNRRRGGASLADEFGDLLVDRERKDGRRPKKSGGLGMGDVYEELRSQAKRPDAFERSKLRRTRDDTGNENGDRNEDQRPRKRSRFHQEVKRSKKRNR